MSGVQQLSQESSRLLSSCNIINSIFSVVKELVENALDAGATNLEVKLENNGLQKIEVRDNGAGINESDVHLVAKSHFTSKISCVSDLEKLETYGFRGEALGAICAIGQLTITTKTKDDDFSKTYVFDKTGTITSSKPSASSSGTTVIVLNLFYNIPVRKKYYKAEKHRKDDIKKIEDLLCAYGCAQTTTRFTLFNNQNLLWSKTATPDLKVSLIQVLGSSVMKNMERQYKNIENKVEILAFVPKPGVPAFYLSRNDCDRTIVVINKRPVKIKAIDKLLQDIYCNNTGEAMTKNRYPICFLSLTLPPSKVDVNVDPNKSQVLLHNFEDIMETLKNFLQERYPREICDLPISTDKPVPSPAKRNLPPNRTTPTNFVPRHVEDILLKRNPEISVSMLEKENFLPIDSSRLEHDSLVRNKSFSVQPMSGSTDKVHRNSIAIAQTSLLSTNNSNSSLNSAPFTNASGIVCKKLPGNETTKNRPNSVIPKISVNNMTSIPLSSKSNASLTSASWTIDVAGVVHDKFPETNKISTLAKMYVDKVIMSPTDSLQIDNFVNATTNNQPTGLSNRLRSSKHENFVNNAQNIYRPTGLFQRVNCENATTEQNAVLAKQLSDNNFDKNLAEELIDDPPKMVDQMKIPSFQKQFNTCLTVEVQQQHGVPVKNNVPISEGKVECRALPVSSDHSRLGVNYKSVFIPKSNIPDDGNQSSYTTNMANTEFVTAKDIMTKPSWSTGKVTASDQQILQPVAVLNPNQQKKRVGESDVQSVLPKRPKSINDTNGSPNTLQKPASGFEIFCQDKRLETALQNPGISNQEMASLFLEQWKNLPVFKQQSYQERSKGQNKNSPARKSPKNVSPSVKGTLKENIVKKKKKKKNAFLVKSSEKTVVFKPNDVMKLKTLSNENRCCADISDSNLRPIANISSGVWICSKERKLLLLNSNRIRERLLFHRLLETYHLTCDDLAEPIDLSPRNLGDEESYKTLLVQCMKEPGPLIMCQYFVGNGFKVTFSKDSCTVKLIGLTSMIDPYGLQDFREVLQLLNKNTPLSLANVRPSKVIQFLQSEAIRISKQSLVIGKKNELNDLLNQADKYITSNLSYCCHNKPFYHELFDLSTILEASK